MNRQQKSLLQSFQNAFLGFWEVLRYEISFRIMAGVAVLAIAGMLFFPLTRTEKVVLLTMIFAVLCLELINSVIERLLDFIEPKFDERIRRIKNLMASIVLLACFGAVIIGAIIFLPYIISFFS
jgi:undecaprenol kinase/diacylglycerol kinase (ATP)